MLYCVNTHPQYLPFVASQMLHDSKQPLSYFLLLVINFYAFHQRFFLNLLAELSVRSAWRFFFFFCFCKSFNILPNKSIEYLPWFHTRMLRLLLLLLLFFGCQDCRENCGSEQTEVRDQTALSSTSSVSCCHSFLISFKFARFVCAKN